MLCCRPSDENWNWFKNPIETKHLNRTKFPLISPWHDATTPTNIDNILSENERIIIFWWPASLAFIRKYFFQTNRCHVSRLIIEGWMLVAHSVTWKSSYFHNTRHTSNSIHPTAFIWKMTTTKIVVVQLHPMRSTVAWTSIELTICQSEWPGMGHKILVSSAQWAVNYKPTLLSCMKCMLRMIVSAKGSFV